MTSGATGAMHAALLALLNAGDECVVLEPFYGYHVSTLKMHEASFRSWCRWRGRTLALDADRLRAAITPRTRAIILNSPSNPSGKVFSLTELEALAAFAIEHDLFVFTDEMYEYFIYDGAQHISIATLPGMAGRTITISGFSKTFSVTGWRLGYLAASERWLPAIAYFHDLTYVCAPSPLQHGAAAGLLPLPQSFYDELAAEYQAKRDMICAALTRAGLTPSMPTGAYYMLADSSRIPGADAKQKARRLLADAGIAAVAGSAFFGGDAERREPRREPAALLLREEGGGAGGGLPAAGCVSGLAVNPRPKIRTWGTPIWGERKAAAAWGPSRLSCFCAKRYSPSTQGPAGDGGDQHDLVAVFELVGVAAEEADVFVVDVDVDEAAELAVLVLDVLRERGKLGVELGQQAGEVVGLGLKRLLSVGMAGQRGGQDTDIVYAHVHAS